MEIDRNKTYIIGDYTFTNYICLPDNQIRQILEWRNHEEVRRWMYNSDIISYESHIKYIDSLRTRGDAYYWLVSYQGEPVGAVYLTNVCCEADTAELGMYYRQDRINHSPFGIDYVHTLYDFVINQLHIGRIYGNIRKDNKNSLVLTLFMGASVEREEEVNKIKYIHTLTTSDSFNQRTSQQQSIKEFLKFVRQYLKNE
ncbi:GNAT family N-acetyltransferase [Bacteroides uniformis]|jgi:UDP-4-amino-4,6-dideoxy-N-acetyl-beta-L-altrosamine N-acetyltransferase|uniref:GNAT family N-acetyltransferase n=1 Tax=Bacteroides uniformis TaxID=820 RepID=UPI0039B38278